MKNGGASLRRTQAVFQQPANRLALVCVLLVQPALAWALKQDSQQPINIVSDRLELDEKRGRAVYIGAVTMTQGSIVLKADRLVLVTGGTDQVQQIIAEGAPSTFHQNIDKGKGQTEARARHMEYWTERKWLLLEGDAFLKHGRHQFSGEVLEYDVGREVVQARKGSEDKGRVRIVIDPERAKP
ncbi:MAG: lipopolysaccharide transport periplasmic protein LptA [Gammaproteobacteria bacterium]|nr:lipopolysaccharide transport periplasmic protein LptA [Gammaproteobacteria bacterium]